MRRRKRSWGDEVRRGGSLKKKLKKKKEDKSLASFTFSQFFRKKKSLSYLQHSDSLFISVLFCLSSSTLPPQKKKKKQQKKKKKTKKQKNKNKNKKPAYSQLTHTVTHFLLICQESKLWIYSENIRYSVSVSPYRYNNFVSKHLSADQYRLVSLHLNLDKTACLPNFNRHQWDALKFIPLTEIVAVDLI